MSKPFPQNSRSKPFQWSKLAGKLNKGAKAKSESRKSKEQYLLKRDSSSSSDQEEDGKVTSRQKELLIKKTPSHKEHPLLKSKELKKVTNGDSWLKSARQTELIRSGSNSSLPGPEKEQVSSCVLQKQWPSTARTKEFQENSRLEWSGSAGSREYSGNDHNRDSAGSTKKSESGVDILVESVRFGRIRHIKLLLEGGTDPNAQNHEGVTPLVAAVADVSDSKLCHRLILKLLEGGADPNVGDQTGTTPLMHASLSNNYEAAVTLLQNERTDPGLQNYDGFSALMYAASRGLSSLVLLLLASFKNVHHLTCLGQKNNEGLTALDLAERYGHRDVSSLLRSDIPLAPRHKGLSGFIPAAHDLSRSPTPTESIDYSWKEPEYRRDKFESDKTLRRPSPSSDLEGFDSLSLSYELGVSDYGTINLIETDSYPGSVLQPQDRTI